MKVNISELKFNFLTKNYTICCPNPVNHQGGEDRNPSCSVYASYDYFCFSCGAKGNLKRDSITYVDLKGKSGSSDMFKNPMKITKYYEKFPSVDTNKAAQDFVYTELGLTKEFNRKAFIRCDPHSQRITFPIVSFNGRFVLGIENRTYVDDEPKTVYYGPKTHLYLQHLISFKTIRPTVLVEGPKMASILYCKGFGEHYNIVASMGKSITSEQQKLLRDYSRYVIITLDNDLAGQQASIKLKDQLYNKGRRLSSIIYVNNTIDDYDQLELDPFIEHVNKLTTDQTKQGIHT